MNVTILHFCIINIRSHYKCNLSNRTEVIPSKRSTWEREERILWRRNLGALTYVHSERNSICSQVCPRCISIESLGEQIKRVGLTPVRNHNFW